MSKSVETVPTGKMLDAFGRFRVANPQTLFDSKQLHDADPLRWDDQEVSGTGTSSAFTADNALTTMSVTASTAGKRVRQSKMRFNYQPGKSQLIVLTAVMGAQASGITQQLGYFDDSNGVFFSCEDGVLYCVVRTFTSGAAVDTKIPQSQWNGDRVDGKSRSGSFDLDLSKANIFFIDVEWLAVGRVRFGVFVAGQPVVVHSINHENTLDTVYMTTPNLPVRYSLENDGAGDASSLRHICSTVISEGGAQDIGVLRYKSTEGTHVDANVIGTVYAVVGLRLKSTHLDCIAKVTANSMLIKTNDDFEWKLIINPTVAGTFTYSDETNSCVQTAAGATANTVTGGTDVDGGWIASNSSTSNTLRSALYIGSLIDGTPDEIVLCARPLTSNADIEGSLQWREYS